MVYPYLMDSNIYNYYLYELNPEIDILETLFMLFIQPGA
jgi:hypothetical protein